MLNKKKYLLLIAVLLLAAQFVFSDEKGSDIAKKNHDLKKANDSSSELTMTLIDKNGSNSFIEFLEPADVKGTKFLTIAHKKIEDEQRLYLPALKKPRQISGSNKNGKFMGSDLFYYDMEDRAFEDMNYKFIREEKYNNMDCFVIEATAVASDSPYSRSLLWINKADYFAYKIECYDKKDDSLWKVIAMVEVKTIDGVMMPSKTAVDNKKDGTKTLMQMDNIKLNSGIKDEVFTVQNLEK
jgi:outer membrane lipoprotein-sorting protein